MAFHNEKWPNWRLNWESYTVRECRAFVRCRICNMPIKEDQRYRDGGKGRKAQVGCVLELRRKKTPAARAREE